jgi:PKD repeat protein
MEAQMVTQLEVTMKRCRKQLLLLAIIVGAILIPLSTSFAEGMGVLTASPPWFKYPFNTQPGQAVTVVDTLFNSGGVAVNYVRTVIYFDGSSWLYFPDHGATGTVPAGSYETYTIGAFGPATEGFYRARIDFTYGGGAEVLSVPVELYNFSNFYSPQNQSIRTASNRLNVQQTSRVACALNGSRFTYFADLLDNLFDGSLIIGTSADNLSWQIYQGIGADPSPSNPYGLLYAQSDISSDSTSFPFMTGYRSAWGKGTNRDSTIGFDVEWFAPKHIDSGDFYVGHFSVYTGPKCPPCAVTNLTIAYAADWDIPTDTAGNFRNTAGVDNTLQLLYQQGAWGAPNNERFGGMAIVRDDKAAIPGGYVWSNDISVTPNGGTYENDSLWNRMETTNGLNAPGTTENFNSVVIVYRDATINGTAHDTLKFSVILAGQRPSGSLAGLKSAVAKAQKFICSYVAPGSQLCMDCSSCGDANSDEHVGTVGDAVFILNYIFTGGSAPLPSPGCVPYSMGDVDTCGSVNVADAAYLMRYIFLHGNPPCQRSTSCYQSSSADRVTLGCPVSAPVGGDSVAVPIYVTNSVPLLGLSIGFRHNSSDAEVTSVSFAGSVADSINYKSAFLLPDSNKILIGFMGDYRGILQPQTDGLLATMWLNTKNAAAQVINFDSCFVAPAGEFIFAPQSGGAIRPEYVDCDTGDVIIPLRPPRAAFGIVPDSGFAPLSVQMTDQSTLTPTSWRWSFGDGDSSTLQNPSHVYQSPGTKYPRLIVCNTEGCDTASHTVRPFDSLSIDFSATPTHGRKPLWVSFSPQFSLAPDSVRWLFGDGGTSATPNPVHAYQNSGIYDVSLKAYKFGSLFTLQKSGFVQVSDVRANFGANVRCGSMPLTVVFSDSSTSSLPLTHWYWDFGDGDTSQREDPTHQFNSEGAFDVKLVVSDSVGADTLTREGYVTSQQSLGVDFTGMPTLGRSPLTVMFDPLLQGIANEYHWDFGDGDTSLLANPIHIYQAQGTFNVKFRARLDLDGCDQVDSVIKSAFIVVQDLQPDFVASPTSGMEPLMVQFTDSSTGNPTGWFWDFGDGSNSYAQSPSHVYDTNGTYDVFLRVTNAIGVDSLEKLSYIYVDSSYVDLCGEIYGGSARPGFTTYFHYVWTNTGTESTQNSVLKILLPPELVSVSIDLVHTHTGTYSGYSLSGDTLVIPLETIAPSGWFGGYVATHGQVPETTPIGDTLVCQSWLSTTSPESHLANNYVVAKFVVVGSLDPNDKLADPGGKELSFGLAPDQRINYTVQFENKEEATAEAIYVRVVDTLDTDLDWGTLSIGPMSHPDKCTASFDPYKGIITWFCDGIMLPPNANPPEGEGYVTYSIKPKAGLSVGTEISNSAWIRFDYNPWLGAPEAGPIVRTILPSYICGDANADGSVDISDVVYLIAYIFSGGSGPEPLDAGDANCDSSVDISDVVYLIAYIFSGGLEPCDVCM